MRDQQRHAEFDQGRTDDQDDDEIGGQGRQAHAEKQAGDHGEKQRDEQVAIAGRQDQLGKADADPGQIGGADQDADGGDRNRHFGAGEPALGQCVDQGQRPSADFGIDDQAGRDGSDNRPEAGHGGGATADHDRDNGRDGHYEKQRAEPVAPAEARPLLDGHRLDAGARRLDSHRTEQAAIIEQRRHQGGDADREIGRAGQLGHHEGGGAHDGRQELATSRGGGLDTARELGLEAALLDHRDGEDAGADDIGCGAARHGAEEGARQHGGVCRTSAQAARRLGREAQQDRAGAHALEHRAEHDIDINEPDHDRCRQAEYAVEAVPERADGQVGGRAGMAEDPGQVPAEQAIGDGQEREQGQGQAHGTPRQFDDDRHADEAERDVAKGEDENARPELLADAEEPEDRGGDGDGKESVEAPAGEAPWPAQRPAAGCGKDEHHGNGRQADHRAPMIELLDRAVAGGIERKAREHEAKAVQEPWLRACDHGFSPKPGGGVRAASSWRSVPAGSPRPFRDNNARRRDGAASACASMRSPD